MILYIIKYTSLKESAEFLFAVMQRPITGEREENKCLYMISSGWDAFTSLQPSKVLRKSWKSMCGRGKECCQMLISEHDIPTAPMNSQN